LRYLIFDTETTGIPRNRHAPVEDVSNWPRLVQIAWQGYDDSEVLVDSREAIIKPADFFIPPEAARVHGITQERALDEGIPLGEILPAFAGAVGDADVLVAHNMRFDASVMGAEFVRAGMETELFRKKRVCTMESSTEYCQIPGPYGFKWPTLSELYYTLFRTSFMDEHNASADVSACARCFFELKHLHIIS
jgi:DNA polymerase-3 subunit epsilon